MSDIKDTLKRRFCEGKSYGIERNIFEQAFDHIEALEAELAAERAKSEWRDIESAPKDGTWILGRMASGDIQRLYMTKYYIPCWTNGRTLPTMNAEPETYEPLHWIPDPYTPQPDETEEG